MSQYNLDEIGLPLADPLVAIPLATAKCKECGGELGEHFHVIKGVVYCESCATTGKQE